MRSIRRSILAWSWSFMILVKTRRCCDHQSDHQAGKDSNATMRSTDAIYRPTHVRIDVNDNKNSTKSDNYMYILTYVVMLIMLIVAQKGKWKYIITNDNYHIIFFLNALFQQRY